MRNLVYDIIIETLETHPDKTFSAPELMDSPAVRQEVMERYGPDFQTAVNKLSDLLGFLWRRGRIKRYPGTIDGSKARFVYGIKSEVEEVRQAISPPTNPARKPVFSITEGPAEVTLDFEYFTLIVRRK